MNVLVIGGGGREHALAWKIAQSSRVGPVSRSLAKLRGGATAQTAQHARARLTMDGYNLLAARRT